MAGYSGTPLAKKLGFKPGTRATLVGAPRDYAETLGALPEGVELTTALTGEVDLIQLFVTEEADLIRRIGACREALATAGALWVSWPKGKAKAAVPTDLDEGKVRTHGLAAGLVDVKVCAVDEVWSGLKLVRRLKDR
jgi:hypothetical protein